MGPGASQWDHRGMEDSYLVWRVTLSDTSRRRSSVTTSFSTETMASGCIVERKQVDDSGIMAWAMFWATLRPIIPIAQSLTADWYVNIIADQVHPFMAIMFLYSLSLHICSSVYFKKLYCEDNSIFALILKKIWWIDASSSMDFAQEYSS